MENLKGGDISKEHIKNKIANVRTYDAELWRVRPTFISPRLSKQLDSISHKENTFVAM
jgi:hypothetical protein